MSDNRPPTRKGCTPIYVYCLPNEKVKIEELAKSSGHSSSSYLRLVGQGYVLRSVVDFERVQELARINGDLGRLGGLLKLWLTDDAKLAAYDLMSMSKIILGVLNEIRDNQSAIRAVMKLVVTPTSNKNLAAKVFSEKTSKQEDRA